MSELKYVVCPGTVRSSTDGDLHWVGYAALVQLYGVNPRECIHVARAAVRGLSDLIPLRPRTDGKYELLKEE